MKTCKGFCRKHNKKNFEFCCDEEGNTIIVSFGVSPGRNKTYNKNCKVCEYWVTSTQDRCFCCKNQYHSRKYYNPLCTTDKRILPTRKRKKSVLPTLENNIPITHYFLLVQEITTK